LGALFDRPSLESARLLKSGQISADTRRTSREQLWLQEGTNRQDIEHEAVCAKFPLADTPWLFANPKIKNRKV
jgi:hypothetical protein